MLSCSSTLKKWAGWSLIVSSLLLFFTACSDDETLPEAGPASDYFPLSIGKVWDYRIDSVVFDPSAGFIRRDSSTTFLREICTDTLRDAEGELLYRIEHWERKSDTLPLRLVRVVFRLRNEVRAEERENNLRFVPLVFPAHSGRVWDGLAFIDPQTEVQVAGETLQPFRNWSFRIAAAPVDTLLEGRFWPRACAVEAGTENLIELRRLQAVYADGVGLVYRSVWILDSQNLSADLAWEQKAEKGYILRQYLTNP